MIQNKIKEILEGKNAFITGSSFAGRADVMKILRDGLNPGHTVYLAPSRKDAARFQAEELHSFFAIGCDGRSLEPDRIFQRKIAEVKTIVIDEIQLVDAKLFTAIDQRLRQTAAGEMRILPFGGKQLIVCGDFYEFQPERTRQSLYAFQCASWEAADFCCIVADTPIDTIQGQFLAAIRHGLVGADKCPENSLKTQTNAIRILNQDVHSGDSYEFQSRKIILTGTKTEADRINAQQMQKLHTKKFVSSALSTCTEDYVNGELPVDFDLSLQVGTRVIAMQSLCTQNGHILYEKGDLGKITRIEFDQDGMCACQVRFDNGNVLPVVLNDCEPFFFWKYVLNPKDGNLQQQEKSSYIQLPLMPAYALSLHDCAGFSFHRVTISAERGEFAPGELYTVLSRCKSLESLCVSRPVKAEDFFVDQEVVDLYRKIDERMDA